MASIISTHSLPARARETTKVPRKLFVKRDALMLHNLEQALAVIEKRDGKVNLGYKETDPRSHPLLFGSGVAALTAAINKVRAAVVAKKARTV